MMSHGLVLAAGILLLAADGLARPVPLAQPVPAPAPPCRFTLEREAAPADGEGEVWVLTCHRVEAPAAATSRAVSLRWNGSDTAIAAH